MRTMRQSALILLIALLFGSVPAHAEFRDVPANSRYAEAFAYLQKKNIVMGFADGTVQPSKLLSRVEGLASVLRLREQYAPQIVWFTENLPEMALFSDLDQKAWYAAYVEVGFLEGVVKGMGNGTFHPANSLTVEQALVMLRRAMKNENPISFRTSDRISNRENEWYTDAVSWAIDRNLIGPSERIALGTPITRGQFFSILYRLHSIETRGLYAFTDVGEVAEGTEGTDVTFTPSGTSVPSVTSVPSITFAPSTPIPFSVSPLPFNPNDPFALTLPPPTTTYSPDPVTTVQQHEYGSQKEFSITIPSLGITDVTISHPGDPFTKDGILAPLKDGLGHLFAYPGNSGKGMIYGHSSGYAWDMSEYTRVFRKINQMVAGERVYITYDGQLHVYEVTKKQVIDAKDVSPFNDDGTDELILYTCWPPDSIKQRYLVHATEVDTVALR